VSDTRARLLRAAADTVRDHGVPAASARGIAARAGINQALVFHHFRTVGELVEAACRLAADEAADGYRDRFASVTSLAELLEVGRALHQQELANGNVAMMGELMSGARHDPMLRRAAGYAMTRWVGEIEPAVRRVLLGSPVADLVDSAGIARAISASFIGLQLYDGVDPDGAGHAVTSLERLAVLLEVLDDLGPIARRALRAKLKGITPDPAALSTS
jgi:AcrR family transcriptional regulator